MVINNNYILTLNAAKHILLSLEMMNACLAHLFFDRNTLALKSANALNQYIKLRFK